MSNFNLFVYFICMIGSNLFAFFIASKMKAIFNEDLPIKHLTINFLLSLIPIVNIVLFSGFFLMISIGKIAKYLDER